MISKECFCKALRMIKEQQGILDVLDLDIPYVQRPMAEMGKIALELLKNRASQPEGNTASVQRIELNPTLVYKK